MLDYPATVDQEGAAQGHRLVHQDVVVPGDGFGQVGHHGELHLADAPLLDRGALPRQVGEVGIDGAGNHRRAALLELLDPLVEGDDLGGADEGEIEGIEEQDDVLALGSFEEVILLADPVVGHDRGGHEIRGLLVHQYAHCRSFPDVFED